MHRDRGSVGISNSGVKETFRRLLWATVAAAGLTTCNAQVQANPFLDDSTVQPIYLTMAPADWAALQQNYLLNTYYHATFAWNGISEDIGIRSRGGSSRSPVKPNFDLNFAKYTKTQTFLGLPFITAKANNADPSNLREWIAMKLFRKMGLPAPREAPAQIFLNGQVLGFYMLVEHEDENFLQRNFGESSGYLYEWQDTGNYEFENLGTDPNLYAPLVDLKTDQDTPDLQTLEKLVAVINQPASAAFTDDQFVAALSQYLNPSLFMTHLAVESALSEADGVAGGIVGMNNFDLYQFQGTTLYQMIAWDKDLTFSDPNRSILFGLTTGTNINLLAQRLMAIPQYRQVYFNSLAKAISILGGAGGWADQAVNSQYSIIVSAAVNDPNKQCPNAAGLLVTCGPANFQADVQWLHTFLAARYPLVMSQLASNGYVPATNGPQIQAHGVMPWGGSRNISPDAVTTINGSNLGVALQASATPLPRIMGDTFVSVEGVRAPLFATGPNTLQFLIPDDIPLGDASIVVSNAGSLSNTAAVRVDAATPDILAVLHADGTAVTPASPAVAGETIIVYATGLGTLTGNLALGAAAPSSGLVTNANVVPVLLNTVPLTVAFAGLAPGYVGLYQINAVVAPAAVAGTTQMGLVVGTSGQSASWQPQ